MRFLSLLLFGFIFSLVAMPIEAKAHQPSQYGRALDGLIAEIRKHDLSQDPIEAGFKGDMQAARHLPDISLSASKNASQTNALFLARHRALPTTGFTAYEQLNYDLIGFVLSQRALTSQMDQARIPFTNDSGFYSNLGYITRQTKFETAQDFQAYIARLSEVPRFFDQHIENMTRGLKSNFTAPLEIMPGVITGIENLTAIAPEDHPLAAPFKTMDERIAPETRAKLRQQGLIMMDKTVMPAYRKALNFMETQYLPKARKKIGLSSVPGGAQQYEALVKYYTTLNITPDQVHAIGLSEVKRIRAKMDVLIKETGFEGSFAQFLNFLRTDPQFYAKSREDLLKEASWIAKRIDGQMPQFFKTLPRLSYGVMAVPTELEENYTTGRYFGGDADRGKAGNYVVNTFNLSQRPLYNLPALTLHEGVPGHHHQISLASEQKDVPEFRQDLYPHAFGEGWGLYAETLGEAMGIYRTPYEKFGRLTYEMWRACRLVMDTGMHYKGWSREQAQSCLTENSALAPHNIKTETDRYISWPGQALAYKMGELKILELRDRAKSALGAQFDIREFHDAVLLNGAMPLSKLERQVNRWIDSERRKTAAPNSAQ